MVAHFTATPYFRVALAASIVIWSLSCPSPRPEIVVFQLDIEIGRINFSRIVFQMIRVISSPSISTMGFLTLILPTGSSCSFALKGIVGATLRPLRRENYRPSALDCAVL